jgi:hypothetical protein
MNEIEQHGGVIPAGSVMPAERDSKELIIPLSQLSGFTHSSLADKGPMEMPQSAALVEKRVKLPGAELEGSLPDTDEAYIPNPYAGKDLISPRQAVDCINFLSGALLADGRKRA